MQIVKTPRRGGRRAAVVAASSLLIFMLLASAMATGLTASFDRAVADAFHSHARANPLPTDLARVVTAVGSFWSVALIAALTVVGLVVAGRLRMAVFWIAAIAGYGAFGQILKWAFHRPRPVLPDPLVNESTWGFPSGHTLGSVVCFGLLAYVVCGQTFGRRGRLVAVAGAAFLATCIGFSRLYLGAHYPSDVLGSFGAGVFWLALVIAVEQATRHCPMPRHGSRCAPPNAGALKPERVRRLTSAQPDGFSVHK